MNWCEQSINKPWYYALVEVVNGGPPWRIGIGIGDHCPRKQTKTNTISHKTACKNRELMQYTVQAYHMRHIKAKTPRNASYPVYPKETRYPRVPHVPW